MQTTAERTSRVIMPNQPQARSSSARPTEAVTVSSYAVAEIHAHAAVRDSLLAEAEAKATRETLNRAFIANEFVLECLKPARAPYQAQHLSSSDAARQRKRCDAVKARIAQLRPQLSASGQVAA